MVLAVFGSSRGNIDVKVKYNELHVSPAQLMVAHLHPEHVIFISIHSIHSYLNIYFHDMINFEKKALAFMLRKRQPAL